MKVLLNMLKDKFFDTLYSIGGYIKGIIFYEDKLFDYWNK